MNKFGIFNLLSSFFPPPEQNKGQSPCQKNDLENVLNNLLSSISPEKSQEPPAKKEEKKAPPFPPLQSRMLSAMNSHDEIINRVKKNNSIK